MNEDRNHIEKRIHQLSWTCLDLINNTNVSQHVTLQEWVTIEKLLQNAAKRAQRKGGAR